jgi:hypothetical protein
MVTEEEVRRYRFRTVVQADGRNEIGRFFMWGSECLDNPRVVLRVHSQRGPSYIVDGVLVKDRTPAGIVEALKTQKPKVLSVMDAFELAAKNDDE